MRDELDKLTKNLDEQLKQKPKETEKEIDKNFMNFKKMQEVSF